MRNNINLNGIEIEHLRQEPQIYNDTLFQCDFTHACLSSTANDSRSAIKVITRKKPHTAKNIEFSWNKNSGVFIMERKLKQMMWK